MRQRLLREQEGFTLAEVLVTMVMMLTVMFALYSIFDMSLRVFSFGNDKTEAVENARLGLERMEREIRAAYPYDKAGGDEELFEVWEEDRIVFGNDLNGDRVIEVCSSGASSECETIGYEIYTPSDSETDALGRSNSPAMFNQAAVEYVENLSFEYYDENGNPLTSASDDEADVASVGISLKVTVPGDPPRTQTLSTEVSLRNRS